MVVSNSGSAHLLFAHPVFLQEKKLSLKANWKKMKLTSSDTELVLMFLIKKGKKVRFWVHPVLIAGHKMTQR